MRVVSTLLLTVTVLTTCLFALATQDGAKKFDYQSDVARLRKIVINRDVFLRELISNANDALEKLRLTSLTDPEVLHGAEQMNITLRAYKDEDGSSRLVITDTGIGMSPEELTANLGTLAKSGTTEFLAKAESTDTTGTGNLIGAFGLGFYSSFLVSDRVYVASLAAPSSANPNPTQHVFSSSADESTFEVYPDPRGNSLGRGTEITLVLRDDALEYMDTTKIMDLVNKHSSFATSFPVYLFTQRTEEVPVEDEESEAEESTPLPSSEDEDEEEAVVEEVSEQEEEKTPKTQSITVDEWVQLNSQLPIWTRDPKTVSDEEYERFYEATFKDHEKPLAWAHFTGDSGSGVSFRAIIYIPSHLDNSYWQNPMETSAKDIRLMVKRVFITNDLGEDALPKWASWIKVVVDAEDLPLNVSRETLQSNKFLKQLKSIITRRIIQTLSKLHDAAMKDKKDGDEDDVESDVDGDKWAEISKVYNNVFKLGAVEDIKNRDKLGALVTFSTNQGKDVSLDDYLENRKKGQKQIFYLADMGKSTEDLAKSVFVEKLHARGYQVLLLSEPLDEIFVQNLKNWKRLPFQDVAKAGLKFGDEEEDPAEEKEKQKALTEQYKPLLDWLKKESKDVVRDVVISNRLVTSPCAIVADTHGYTANIEKMMNAQVAGGSNKFMHEYAKKMKLLEINPRSPLIEGLLKRVEQLPSEEEERDLEAEDELREVTSVLIDGALVRSGFGVPDSNEYVLSPLQSSDPSQRDFKRNRFFTRVDRILRRSLGVSETAPTDSTVKPAPPVDSKPVEEEELSFDDTHVRIDPEMMGLFDQQEAAPQAQAHWEVEEIDDEGNAVKPVSHDEL
ncbi:hypothetical protein PHLCEN_2v3861 [Hermanssonia centrifuga]|uniref:Heat shock protein 90 n=1 Tax=Hermanssonia centrifuga TaxID=98765 RepID=A0A2R6QB56_9APHY|nr:hypothetical protein PHLCEN_2v3861 [Hermanssonia centrifuga]